MSEESAETQAKPSFRDHFRAWKLKHPHHIPVRNRAPYAKRVSRNVLDRARLVLWPWTWRNYPGVNKIVAWMLGDIPPATAGAYVRGRTLPRKRARIAAERLRAKAAELLAVIEELEAYAAEGENQASKVRPNRHGVKSPIIPPPE